MNYSTSSPCPIIVQSPSYTLLYIESYHFIYVNIDHPRQQTLPFPNDYLKISHNIFFETALKPYMIAIVSKHRVHFLSFKFEYNIFTVKPKFHVLHCSMKAALFYSSFTFIDYTGFRQFLQVQ